MAVLKCINDVKRDFWFATRAHVQYVSDTISKGCSARKGKNSYYCNIPLVRFCFITYDVDLYQDYQKLYNFVSQLNIQRVIISEKVSMNYVEIYFYQSQLVTNTEIIENCTIVCHKITKNYTIVCHKITENCTILCHNLPRILRSSKIAQLCVTRSQKIVQFSVILAFSYYAI